MAGQQGAASTPAPGQGQGASTGSAGAGAQQPKVVFTPEQQAEVERIANDRAEAAAKTAAEEAYRRAQGHADTTTASLRNEVGQRLKQVEETAELFKAAGHEIPADALEKARTLSLQRSFSLPAAPSQAAASGPQAGQPAGEGAEGAGYDPATVELLGNTKLAQAGMAEIDETWPEWKLINGRTQDPVLFLGSIDAAIAAYATRAGASGQSGTNGAPGATKGAGEEEQTQEQRWSRMGAGVVGSGGAGAGSALPDLSPNQLFRQGFDELTRGR